MLRRKTLLSHFVSQRAFICLNDSLAGFRIDCYGFSGVSSSKTQFEDSFPLGIFLCFIVIWRLTHWFFFFISTEV